MKTSSTRRCRLTSMAQSFYLVLLDVDIDDDSIAQLQQVVNNINRFTDVDECIDFITDTEEERTFMIVSNTFSQIIVSTVQEIPQVSYVYIWCNSMTKHNESLIEYSKVKGVYTEIAPLCELLQQAIEDFDRNSISISFVRSTDDGNDQNLNQLDQSFMYTQLLKEILLTIDFEQVHFDEFIAYCREQFVDNTSELKIVDKFEREYDQHSPVWWYTYKYFLSSMLNRALRMMEVDVIIKMGFFIRDLHNYIVELHEKQYITHYYPYVSTVYRGQGLSQTDFEQLRKTQGGLLSFNNFLSASLDREVSFAFAESNQSNPDLIGVLFEIIVNPSISSSPFANIGNVSYYQDENEFLLSMHSVFRIGQLKSIGGNDRLWQVDISLTNDNDPQLHALTKIMRNETFSSYKGWYRLGKLMITLGQFQKAEELYEILLKQTTSLNKRAYLFQQLGQTAFLQGKYDASIAFYEKSLKIYREARTPDHRHLAASYNNIGLVYGCMGEYSKALSYYEKSLKIDQKTFPENHPNLGTSYNNIGLIYKNMGEYSKALLYYEKTLEIYERTLPENHPNLATVYNNIGWIYRNLDNYSKALFYYQRALDIRQRALTPNHPDLEDVRKSIDIVKKKV